MQGNSPSGTTDLGQSQLDTPDLTLVAQTIFADELQLRVPTQGLTKCPRHKRSTLSLSGHGNVRTDERTRKDDGGRCTSSSSCGAPWWLSMERFGVVRWRRLIFK